MTFFPAIWLTLGSGRLFGFLPCLIYALIGEKLRPKLPMCCGLAGFSPPIVLMQKNVGRIQAFKQRLNDHAFPTVVVLLASYLPFDLVNYGCGLLRVT